LIRYVERVLRSPKLPPKKLKIKENHVPKSRILLLKLGIPSWRARRDNRAFYEKILFARNLYLDPDSWSASASEKKNSEKNPGPEHSVKHA
jgi:hypothetical protein